MRGWGGGWLGPDLTGATAKYGAGLAGVIENPSFPTMQGVFAKTPASAEEAAAPVLAGTAQLGNNLNWRGDVDRVIEVSLRHRSVRVNVITGRSLRHRQQDTRVEGFLPARPVTVRLENVEGPGTVEIVQQPEQANDYTARVRITNSEPSRAEFRFILLW